VALQADQSWTGKYVLDFGKLLTDADANKTEEETTENIEGDDNDEGQPVFFLHIIMQSVIEPAAKLNGTSAMVLRNQDSTVAKLDSAAGPCFTVVS